MKWVRPSEELPELHCNRFILFIANTEASGAMLFCGWFDGDFADYLVRFKADDVIAWRYAPALPDWVNWD